MSRPIAHGAYFTALEKVAEAAYEMCQHLDMHEEEIKAWGWSKVVAHDRLHNALKPYEEIKYGEDA